jgi:hypothetical protein
MGDFGEATANAISSRAEQDTFAVETQRAQAPSRAV